MPIKFRCNYCRQFLGISRNRAGGVVDCPTCGRSIRVPELDGSVAPIPDPAFDGDDAHLARALDELAALAQVDGPLKPVAVELGEPDDEIPQPLPEPVPVEIPMPVSVKPIAPPMTASAPVDEPAPIAAADVLEELAAAASPAPASPKPSVVTAPAVSTQQLMGLVYAPVLTLIIGAGLGWLIGRGTSSAPAAGIAVNNVKPKAADALATTAQGRISYQTDDGDIRPDIGACVMALPVNWDAASRLPPIGLRPADSPADQKVVAGTVTGMDGTLTWTDAEGHFELALPAAGAYRLVVLSRLASRATDEAVPADDDQLLRAHLQDPNATIGRRAYLVRDVEAKAGSPAVWDHQFVR